MVELVVGTAILAVVGLTVSMLLTSGTNMYRGVHRSSTVLFKSTVAANQIQKAVVDSKYPFAIWSQTAADGEGTKSTDTIMVGGEDAENPENKVINVYYYDDEKDAIYLRVDSLDITGDNVQINSGDPVPFCFNVKSIDYNPQFNESTNQTYALKLSMVITKFGLDYNRNETISLRNRPTLVSGASAEETEQLLAEKLGDMT